MSDTNQQIGFKPKVEGRAWQEYMVYRSQHNKLAYFLGQDDIVEAGFKDMSHYRRRSPDEKPSEKDGEYVIYLNKGEYQPDITRTQYFIHQIYGWDEIEFWAYLYVPQEEQK